MYYLMYQYVLVIASILTLWIVLYGQKEGMNSAEALYINTLSSQEKNQYQKQLRNRIQGERTKISKDALKTYESTGTLPPIQADVGAVIALLDTNQDAFGLMMFNVNTERSSVYTIDDNAPWESQKRKIAGVYVQPGYTVFVFNKDRQQGESKEFKAGLTPDIGSWKGKIKSLLVQKVAV